MDTTLDDMLRAIDKQAERSNFTRSAQVNTMFNGEPVLQHDADDYVASVTYTLAGRGLVVEIELGIHMGNLDRLKDDSARFSGIMPPVALLTYFQPHLHGMVSYGRLGNLGLLAEFDDKGHAVLFNRHWPDVTGCAQSKPVSYSQLSKAVCDIIEIY